MSRHQIVPLRRRGAYLTWGTPIPDPAYGCIIVFTREGGGHDGFVVGWDEKAIHVLGGNQFDPVNIRTFPVSRVTDHRWPQGEPLDYRPMLAVARRASTSEA